MSVFLTKDKFPIHCKDTNEVCHDYQSYLNSVHWRNFKKAYYNSNLFKSRIHFGGINSKCVCCQIPNKPLDIHHISYKRIGNERMFDVIPLCRDCHFLVHTKIKLLIENRQINNSWKIIKSKSWKKIRKQNKKLKL
jgi:hypothetical protein